MVMSFLSNPLAAVTPERADMAALITTPDAETSGGTFLAELQKALSPDMPQPDNLAVPEATSVEIANFTATPEILLKSEKSFKSREAFKTDKTAEIPAVNAEEISEIPVVTAQEIVEILLLNLPAQPQSPQDFSVKEQTGELPFKTLPIAEARTFRFDSVPEIPVQITPGNPVLKAELPVENMEAGNLEETFIKLGKAIDEVNAGLLKSSVDTKEIGDFPQEKTPDVDLLKASKTVTENLSLASDIAVQSFKNLPVVKAKKSEIPAFTNDVRVLEGAIVSLEVTLPKEKIPTEKEERTFSFTMPESVKEMPETGDFTEEKKSFKSDIPAFKNEITTENSIPEKGEKPVQNEMQLHKPAQISETKIEAQFPNIVNSANPAFKTPAPQVVRTEVLHVPVMSFTETAVPAIQKLEKADGGTMRLVLMPEALGQVKLEVVVENKIHTAITIQVENHEAKRQIEAQMPALKEQLVQSGMVIDKMNVEVKTDFKNLSQFAGFQQQPKQEERESRKKFVDSFKYLRETVGEDNSEHARQFIEQYI
jgi:hypothetical protein